MWYETDLDVVLAKQALAEPVGMTPITCVAHVACRCTHGDLTTKGASQPTRIGQCQTATVCVTVQKQGLSEVATILDTVMGLRS